MHYYIFKWGKGCRKGSLKKPVYDVKNIAYTKWQQVRVSQPF